jgi:hypothetical protein
VSKEKRRRAVALIRSGGAVTRSPPARRRPRRSHAKAEAFHRVAQGRVGTSKEGSLAAIQEIEASYGEKGARIVEGRYETQDEIEPVEGRHADLFTAQQRAGAARTQKAERARANAEEYRKERRDSSHILLSNYLMTPGGCIAIG